MEPQLFLILLLCIPWSLPKVSFSRILAVAFISSKSHKITYEPLLRELGARGHEITVLTPIKSSKRFYNVQDIQTLDVEQILANSSSTPANVFELKRHSFKGVTQNTFLLNIRKFEKICEMTLDMAHVKELHSKKFDLILLDVIFNECAAGYVHKFNTSLILISSASASSWILRYTGGSSLPSLIPNVFTDYTHQMNFFQRTINFITEVSTTLIHSYYFIPKMEAIYRQKLNDAHIPSVHEILGNASLILSNGHFALRSPKPLLPDVIEVAGMHCRPANPLPKDLAEFVNGAGDHGFIYFSMGSVMRGTNLPENKRKLFLSVFGKMRERVLWKWENDTMPELPANVKLSKWFPQQDILGHPKLRVFITHGGFGSLTEAVYHASPLIGIPIYADQELNIALAEKQGFGIRLSLKEMNEERILEALDKVLTDSKYKENVKAVSKVFRDQPDKPLERAVYWVEYVIRHKGAVHLRSVARNLNFFQYFSLDVIGLSLALLLTPIILLYSCIKFIIRKFYFARRRNNFVVTRLKTKKKN